jgi:DNA-binding NtrC family response regulator
VGDTPLTETNDRQSRPEHTVLVVDDERGARDALRMILEPHFRVLTADTGELALETLKREPISVMTLDLRMPGLSGPETLLKIREINSDLEVVIVTAYASYGETMRALRLRAFDLVAKPFESGAVLKTIRRAAERYESRRRASSHEALEGLTSRLIESIRGLSESESQSLSQNGKVTLDQIRAQAQNLLRRLTGDADRG